MGAHHNYTAEQLDFLERNYLNMTRVELTNAFNKRFNVNYHRTTIIGVCNKHGWHAKTDGRFTSETSPRWQAGLSKTEFKAHYTEESLRKMVTPMIEGNRVLHIGDTFIRNGIPYVLIDETSGKSMDARSENKARYIYEQAYGKIDNNDLIIHLDNDVMNCELSNLARIPQKWRAHFIHNGWWHASADIKKAAIEYCRLMDAIKEATT